MRELSFAQYEETYFDPATAGKSGVRLYETEASDVLLPERKPVSHKYSYGRALVIAGSRGFSGAPVLAANACERSGAGLTHLMIPDSIYGIAAAKCDGSVVSPLPAVDGHVSAGALPEILEALKKADACVIGPGFGTGEDSKAVVEAVLREAVCPLVLDADALTVCAGEPGLLSACRAPLILTPHTGEFKRLGGELANGRLAGALRFAGAYPNVILLLKGYGTLVCRGDEIAVNPTGGPAMAKGGSGDVLAGMLGSLLAQGLSPIHAACLAVYFHGAAGDAAANSIGEYGMTPTDMIGAIPGVLRHYNSRVW